MLLIQSLTLRGELGLMARSLNIRRRAELLGLGDQ
jgi:hypothetical protein